LIFIVLPYLLIADDKAQKFYDYGIEYVEKKKYLQAMFAFKLSNLEQSDAISAYYVAFCAIRIAQHRKVASEYARLALNTSNANILSEKQKLFLRNLLNNPIISINIDKNYLYSTTIKVEREYVFSTLPNDFQNNEIKYNNLQLINISSH